LNKKRVARARRYDPRRLGGDWPLREILDNAADPLRAVDQQVLDAGGLHRLRYRGMSPRHLVGREARIGRLDNRPQPGGQIGRRERATIGHRRLPSSGQIG
jgi:hypothetical protein